MTRWQAHIQRRGFSIGADAAGTFDAGSRQAARDAQSRYGLTDWDGTRMSIDGIVGPRTWATTTSYPALSNPVTPAAFADLVGEDFVVAHRPDDRRRNRHRPGARPGAQPWAPADRRRQPARRAARRRRPTRPAPRRSWWPTTPPASGPDDTDARGWGPPAGGSGTPRSSTAPTRSSSTSAARRSSRWDVDFATIGLPAGTTHALLVVAATATSADPGASDNELRSAERDVKKLIEGAGAGAGETKAAARLVRLDPVAPIP